MSPPDVLVRLADQDAYRSWSSARSALYQSVQAYERASNALGPSLIHSASQHLFTHNHLDQTSPEFDSELALFHVGQQELQTAHIKLLRSKNQSGVFAPINRLSVELLSIIFRAACFRPTDEDDSPSSPSFHSPERIAGVCQTWRSIALGLPSLWSRLGLILRRPSIDDTSLRRFQLRVERSLTTALDLNLWVQEDLDGFSYDEWDEGYATRTTITKLLEALSPLTSRVQHLDIDLNIDSEVFIRSLLVLFARPGAIPVPSIILRSSYRDKSYDHPAAKLFPWEQTFSTIHSNEEPLVQDFLHSVRYLTLSSVHIPWSNKAYSDLTSLHLSDADLELDFEQVGAILASSPALHTLSITSTSLTGINLPEPVDLPNLQSITLGDGNMNESDVGCVLGLIATCSSNLSLHLITYGDYNHDDFERFRSFFRRSQLTALRIEMKGSGTWFDLVEESLDHLETLTLEGCSIWDRPLQDFIEALDDPDTSDAPIPWPKLHALYLKDCWIHKPLLLSLLSLHKLKYFELIDRRKPQGRYPSPNHFALEALEEAVREIVGNAHCLGDFLYFKDSPDMSYLETRELGLM